MRWCLALHFGYVEVFDNDHPVALGDGSCELDRLMNLVASMTKVLFTSGRYPQCRFQDVIPDHSPGFRWCTDYIIFRFPGKSASGCQ
jgi:hypothetical protein